MSSYAPRPRSQRLFAVLSVASAAFAAAQVPMARAWADDPAPPGAPPAAAAAAPAPAPTPPTPRERGLEALADLDFAAAATRFEEALAPLAPGAAGADEVLYLLATARAAGGQHAPALAALDRLLAEHAASPLRAKAAAKRAEVFGLQRDFATAAGIYAERLAVITSPERRAGLARAYAELARELAAPDAARGTPATSRDLAAACDLLDKALELGGLPAAEEEAVRLQLIAALEQARPQAAQARTQSNRGGGSAEAATRRLRAACEAFLARFPEAPARAQALFRLGEAQRDLGEPAAAKRSWLRIADELPASPEAPRALLAALRLHLGEDGSAATEGDLARGRALARRLEEGYASTPEAALAAWLDGLALGHHRPLRGAARARLGAFAERHPTHERAPDARIRVAELYQEDGDHDAAIAAYEEFLRRHASSARWPEVQARLAQGRYEAIGRAEQLRDWELARAAAERFVERHPTDPRAPEAARRLGQALVELGKAAEAVEAFRAAAARFPRHAEASRALFLAGQTLAERLERFDDALATLGAVEGPFASEARALADRLRAPALALEGGAVVGAADPARLTLVSRNLDRVSVRVWALDVADYFDKLGRSGGLEALDVSVIAPDRTFEVVVDGAKPLAERKQPLDLGAVAPGAYIVTASAGDLEATTVLVRSDLDLVARASRSGGYAVLLRGGAPVAAELRHASDGRPRAAPAAAPAPAIGAVFRLPGEELATTHALFAREGADAAFVDLLVAGRPVPPRRAVTAQVVPDCAIYAEGERVRVFVVVREPAAASAAPGYAVPAGKRFRLAVVTQQGARLHESDLALSAAGLGAAEVELPRGLLGRLILLVEELREPEPVRVGAAAVFVVEEPAPAPWIEVIATDGPHPAGEPIAATVILRDAWDRPLPDRSVFIEAAPEGDSTEHLTGPDGAVQVRIDTEPFFRLGGEARIAARADGAEAVRWFALASPTPRVELDAERSRLHEPLLPGEPRVIHVRTSRGGKPARGRYRVEVRAEGRAQPVLECEYETDAEGRGSFPFGAGGRAGRYALELWVPHDLDAPAIARHDLVVLDASAAAEQRVFLLSEKDAFRAGQPVALVIYALDAGPALIALEGEDAAAPQLVQLAKGRNAVTLPPPPVGTGDFTVAVQMLLPGKGRQVERDFDVEAASLEVTPAEATYRPGEEVLVRVKAEPGAEVVLVAGEEGVGLAIDATAFRRMRAGRYFAGGRFRDLAFVGRQDRIAAGVREALGELAANAPRPVGLETAQALRRPSREQELAQQFMEGVGQGGAGGFGQRVGRGSLTSHGGSESTEPSTLPVAFLSAVAGADGVASFRFRLPKHRADYALAAFALSAARPDEIATGEGKVAARAPVTAVVRAPALVREGQPSTLAVLLTNHEDRPAAVTLAVAGPAGALSGAEARVTVPPRSTHEHTLAWTGAREAVVALDGVLHAVPVALLADLPPAPERPLATAGGLRSGPSRLDPQPAAADAPIRLFVATSTGAFLDALAAAERDPLLPASSAAARLIVRVAEHRLAASPRAAAEARTFAALRAAAHADLVDDGYAPFLAHLAAAEAKAAGLAVTVEPAPLQAAFAAATDDDWKALYLYALARSGHAQYGYVHRLARAPERLSERGLAALALTLHALEKPSEAEVVLARLLAQIDSDEGVVDDVGARALTALAHARIRPEAARTRPGFAVETGRLPRTPAERALVALALEAGGPREGFAERVRVGERAIAGWAELTTAEREPVPEGAGASFYAFAWTEPSPAAGLPVPAAPRPPALAIQIGGPRARWPRLVVDGVVVEPADATVATGPADAAAAADAIPAMERVAAGERFTLGFTITASHASAEPRRLALVLPGGLAFDGALPIDLADAALGAGAAATGAIARTAGPRLLVWLPPQREAERRYALEVPVYAEVPGASLGADPAAVTVLPAAASFRDGYQPSPGERLAVLRLDLAKERWAPVREGGLALLERSDLQPEAIIECSRALLAAAVALDRPAEAVRAFEVLKERAPAEVISFERIRAVARSYAAQGEHERALQVYQGTLDAYFLQEAHLSGMLEVHGRLGPAVDLMERLLGEYPDTPLLQTMLQGLGQRLYDRARAAGRAGASAAAAGGTPPGGAGAAPGAKPLSRDELLQRSIAAFERWLAWYPGGAATAAPDVHLSLGSAYLEAGRFERAAALAEAAARRFPGHELAQSFDYTRAFAAFALRRFDDALALGERVETLAYGGHSDRAMREQAALMRAHVHHAKGDLDQAIAAYRKLRGSSADARRSLAFLEAEAVVVPAVTVAPLAEPARLELTYAGVAEATVRAYKVDLVALALRRADLDDVGAVEVAGIKPQFERRYALGQPGARRRVTERLELALPEPGAYLVSVKAGGFFANGLVLRSDLTVSVQEERGAPLRVNIGHAARGGFVEGVKVAAIGSDDARIATGRTDLRGVWEGAGLRGLALVVAEKDGHIALYRGTVRLGEVDARPAASPSAHEVDLIEKQVQSRNRLNNDAYWGNVQRDQSGVEVERTKR